VNCPFYGYAMFKSTASPIPFLLLHSGGDQCALVLSAHVPCVFNDLVEPVEWKECPRIDEIQIGKA
jgi:hypothetical protein